MDIPIKDKSNYLRGLLIIAKKDKQLTEPEKRIIRELAEKLGFASDFYEETLRSLLANKYIKEEPIIFSNKKIAMSFIEDGLKLASSGESFSSAELEWLRETAKLNSIEEEWFEDKMQSIKSLPTKSLNTDFALYSII